MLFTLIRNILRWHISYHEFFSLYFELILNQLDRKCWYNGIAVILYLKGYSYVVGLVLNHLESTQVIEVIKQIEHTLVIERET